MDNGENYECQDCLKRAPLNVHGRCGFCDSQAVMSVAIFRNVIGTAPIGTEVSGAESLHPF